MEIVGVIGEVLADVGTTVVIVAAAAKVVNKVIVAGVVAKGGAEGDAEGDAEVIARVVVAVVTFRVEAMVAGVAEDSGVAGVAGVAGDAEGVVGGSLEACCYSMVRPREDSGVTADSYCSNSLIQDASDAIIVDCELKIVDLACFTVLQKEASLAITAAIANFQPVVAIEEATDTKDLTR
mmetsp:Transcript_41385/g.54450  ORF Transcript_41385/g.54450 Transcript_41385/m.54450 type:complete len:180 (+) Transcript_41385:1898-2437(+)|eukprot:CAMPEP_0185570452 /NCGR_PEP_ID=MMETSP0434-20130131/2761_1 /TAXON_ID=626734 ORGANISM="Favella taraikaensis, Strain Fe Narragansett Bay" /NCGR_SAMPLE_ID=MMETSP0434 /ASSEMBLY_ACC=CAM_ASM_000379 /LENGTH=179 /DNA_ID=CAMNT_0028185581 /DNA_START=1877 /DNA_END=2416 /DNA_ORIENTATION=+